VRGRLSKACAVSGRPLLEARRASLIMDLNDYGMIADIQ
jgi:hypothetical protein